MAERALYQPLDTIRLLRISRNQTDTGFDGELVPFVLHSPYRPPFFVVSYFWGPPTYSHSINLNGIRIPILDSICQFLGLLPWLSEFPADSWWWIDSICINQNDIDERSSQVQIMGKIYKAAEKTVVWLGPTIEPSFPPLTQDCRDAVSSLQLLHKKRKDFTDLTTGDIDRSKCLSLRKPKSGINWKAIECLLLRPWWRRVWTLQEFIIADQLVFYCGTEHIGRGAFQAAMYALSCTQGDDLELVSKAAFASAWNRRRLNQWFEKRPRELRLLPMIAFVGDCGATDDRDRIYAFMGLASDFDIVGRPDYNCGIDELYAGLVKSFIERYSSLDIICFAHLFNHFTKRNAIGTALPSWVPDWRAQLVTKAIPLMISQGSNPHIGNFRPLHSISSSATYTASGPSTPHYSIEARTRTLICEGIIIDTIDGLGGSQFKTSDWKNKREQERGLPLVKSTSKFNTPTNETKSGKTNGGYSLIQSVSRCLVLDRGDRYLNHSIPPHHFFDDFIHFCRAALDTPELVHPIFLNWFETNKSLSIRGRTLANDCRKPSGKIMRECPELDNMSDRKGFLSRFKDTVESMGRRLCVTDEGWLGMAPSRAQKGDLVVVLLGCSVPVVLRRRHSDGNGKGKGKGKEGEGALEFVGECYLHGFMNGEALEGVREGRLGVESLRLE